MQKFKFSFKIKELELQVEGAREDVAAITSSIGQQFKGLIQPAGSLGDADTTHRAPLQVTEEGEITDLRTVNKKKRSGAGQQKTEKAKAIDVAAAPDRYGAPVQTWITVDKAIWLLYVLQQETKNSEFSATELAETFNKQFKQLGKIRASNVSRDLGKQKSGGKALVGENTAVNPAKWFLTATGMTRAEQLIAQLKGGAA